MLFHSLSGTLVKPSQLFSAFAMIISRMCLVIATILVAASTIPIIFLKAQFSSPLALKFAVLFFLGLIAGVTGRILLGGQSFWFMFMVALVGLFGALLLLKPLTLGFIGIWPIYTPFVDWNGIAQFGIVSLAAWIPLRVGKRTRQNRKPKISNSTSSPQKPSRSLPKVKVTNRLERVNAKQPRNLKIHPQEQRQTVSSSNLSSLSALKEGGQKRWKPVRGDLEHLRYSLSKALDASGKWVRSLFIQSRHKVPTPKQRSPVKPSTNHPIMKGHPRPISIRLKGKEEHRCPYCFEIVRENDPRGVEICPICGTYHHADCWAVTGVCQIPHLHT